MTRDGLFFDPLQAESELQGEGELHAGDQAPARIPETSRRRRPSPDELAAQRRAELARVQEELTRMARGSA